MDPKNVVLQKGPKIFNFWNKFLNPHIKPVFFGRNQYIGTINFVLKYLTAQWIDKVLKVDTFSDQVLISYLYFSEWMLERGFCT